MSGDYTRFTFAARKLFSGVLKQQGRVSLDADFNEFQEILDRRDRSEMYDTVGPAVVPQTTPDGFASGTVSASCATQRHRGRRRGGPMRSSRGTPARESRSPERRPPWRYVRRYRPSRSW